MSERVTLMREFLENGPLPVKDLCALIFELMEEPNIITKFKQRVAGADRFLDAGPLPGKDIRGIILEFLAAPELICKVTKRNVGWVNSFYVLPNGNFVAGGHSVAGFYGGVMTLYDACNVACLLQLFHRYSVTAIGELPDGRLVSGSADAKVRVWGEDGWHPVTLEGHCRGVRGLVVMPDGTVASCSRDGAVRVWDPTREVCIAKLLGHTDDCNALAAMPDGKLASGSADGTVRVWDPATGVCVLTIVVGAMVSAVGVLPDGNLVTASSDGMLRIWSANGVCVLAFNGRCVSETSIAVCSDGCIISSNFDGSLHGWDSTTGVSLFRLELGAPRIVSFALLPNGGLVTASGDYEICVWE
jgi:hypothetical protein